MPTPAHRRLTFIGEFQSFANPAYEQWSFRLNLGPGNDPRSLADLAAAGHAAYVANLAVLVPSHVKLLEVKAADIGADGLYTAEPVIFTGAVLGGGGSVQLPTQTAVAVSLVTARRGSSGRGRFYLPTPSFLPIAADGRITAANAATIAGAAAGFLEGLNPAGFRNVVVASSKGFLTVVTDVRVGRVLDTIRSRRTSIDEAYTAPVAVVA